MANMLRNVPEIKKFWGWFLALGILLIVLGALAVGFAGWATEFTVIFLGFLLVIAGVLQITSCWYTKKWSGYSLSLLLGLLYVVAGILCIFKPAQTAAGITLLIAALLLIGGAFRFFSSLSHRVDYWRWTLFTGLVSIALGILILAEWPSSSFWVIGFFVGIDLMLIGWSWVLISMSARK